MLPNSGYELVPIVPGVDYSPAAQTTDFVDPNSGLPNSPAHMVANGVSAPIFALLCTKSSGAGSIVIQALGNTSGGVTILSTAFVAGQVYYIYLKKLLNDNSGAVAFVGYRYAQMPQVF
jgi:hypothetical protein